MIVIVLFSCPHGILFNFMNDVIFAGVNPERLLSGYNWAETKWRRGELLSEFEGKTVMIGVDDLDMFKGIELKLEAFQRILELHPEWRNKLCLVQVCPLSE